MAPQGSLLIVSISTALSAFSHPHSALSSPLSTDPILKAFENDVAHRLDQLKSSAHEGSYLNLPWLHHALENVLITNSAVEALIPDFELPSSEREERWVGEYLDDSAKLLDVCNAFKHRISDFKSYHSQLLFALHHLDHALRDNNSGSIAKRQRARNALLDCLSAMNNHIKRKDEEAQEQGKQLNSCRSTLRRMADKLAAPSLKTSKPFIAAIYGAKLNTIFICGLLEAALAPVKSRRPMCCSLRVPTHFPWSASLITLQYETVKEELHMRGKAASGPRLSELVCIAAIVKRLHDILDNSVLHSRSHHHAVSHEEQQADQELKRLAETLRNQTKRLGEGLELLQRQVKDLFRMLVNSRMALLDLISHSRSSWHFQD